MRTFWSSVLAILVLPVALLIGARGAKKLQRPAGEAEVAMPKPPKIPKALAALMQDAPWETVEALKAAQKAAKTVSRHDRDGDGRLDDTELPGKWRAKAPRFDRDGDGKLSETEFADYLESIEADKKARKAMKAETNRAAPPPPPPPKVEPAPSRVHRPGRLPEWLPVWFTELDEDTDGQVGLYEWRARGREADDFLTLDHNQDGFVTVEEALRARRSRR
jgi:hypothetical protein